MYHRDVTTREAASELGVQDWRFLLLAKKYELSPTRLIGNNKMWETVDVVMVGLRLKRLKAEKKRLSIIQFANEKEHRKANLKAKRELAKIRNLSVKEYYRQYYLKNKKKMKEYSRIWYYLNKDTDEYKVYKKEYCAKNREERNEYAKRYYREHKAQG